MEPGFFATAPRGAESVLADELRRLGVARAEPRRGGVAFGDRLEDAYRACLWARVARRVLLPLAEIDAPDADALYAGVHDVAWSDHLDPERTFAVDVTGRGEAGPPRFVALKTKDAVVDRLRADVGERPDVDTEAPDLRVHVHLAGPRLALGLELAGPARASRDPAGALEDGLASASLLLSGWPGESMQLESTQLFDPLAGSGAVLAEAAALALDAAPGLDATRRLGFEAWPGHDVRLWQQLCAEARRRRRAAGRRKLRLAGAAPSEAEARAIRRRLESAGLADAVRLEVCDLRDVEAPSGDAGLVVTRAPDAGVPAELGPVYELLGDVLKRRFPGWTAWVLCGSPALARRVGLRPASRHVLDNSRPDEAGLDYRLLEIPISTAPVDGARGPGWRRPSTEAAGLAKRLRKNLRRLAPWAKREGIDAYRLYDTDMPLYNLAVDVYGDAVRVEEYAPPRRVAAADAERRLRDAVLVVAEVLEVEPADVTVRVRRRRAAGEQERQRGKRRRLRHVHEGDLCFAVNLEDYLDTGLFLDDRLLRRCVRERAAGGAFLNLFAYTCTASVAAAKGGARATTSVDLSASYLDWGRHNFELNGVAPKRPHSFVRADVVEWLARDAGRPHDLVFVAPPTASRSKAMRGDFDVQRDHVALLAGCARRLAPGGEILFTTNLRGFELDAAGLRRAARGLTAREITAEVTPRDFERRPRLRAWTLAAR